MTGPLEPGKSWFGEHGPEDCASLAQFPPPEGHPVLAPGKRVLDHWLAHRHARRGEPLSCRVQPDGMPLIVRAVA